MAESLGAFLGAKLKEIQQKNPRYSLRCFASKVGISAGALTDLMKNRRPLSDFYADKIASALGLGEDEKSVLLSFVKTKSRKFAAQKILAEKEMKMLTDWENYAILNLMKTEDFQSDPQWIAARLALPEERVVHCLKLLLDLKLVVSRQGKLSRTYNSLATTNNIPSEALVAAHRSDLLKAIEVLQSTSPKIRNFSSVTMAVNLDKLDKAEELIQKFRRSLSTLMQEGEATEVYNLNIQLFPMTRVRQNSKENPS